MEEQFKAFASQLRRPTNEDGVKTGVHMNEGNKIMNLEAIKAVNPCAHDRILEIGMGNGFFVKNIISIDPTIVYTGCDFSETMIEEAEKMNAEYIKIGSVVFYLASADKLPLKDHSYNKLFTVNTIYFWENPVNTLNEFKRVLTKDGELIIVVRPKHIMENIPVTKYGFTMYSKEELIELLLANNFDVLDTNEIEEPSREVMGKILEFGSLVVHAKQK
ncbi:MAG: class I SAM-dependent methyltransferase [Sporocytophaga sp.]|uniref:class I SAM-dependent methyltransferase n=1 Tax=Sporocytophaga sp. TaxID=2231183 RepID=UPI001AFDCF9C|nr:class I SAM-dependent methyltransferase [Sporocytophaga sp.]MBO9703246.1 class I SAM-dependent methyltransferase [Sporocytophaga sp.]